MASFFVDQNTFILINKKVCDSQLRDKAAVEIQATCNLEVAEVIRDFYEAMKLRFTDVLESKHSVAALDYLIYLAGVQQ
ncbi:hypothetical protein [Spectribacter hydrogenoxidans]|uniref:Uncharacterized protein n=1 Tax=Spectribacter hydrogenoxidans TaxID=3075608 RepID=A0ABU3BWG5_9GAMM|nr:hypothetical protein [Salinisphaera sp. W335]MDT0633642.1 hypothetical protein [Salinisphaera sp. W335]